jgi:hypothetical protein
MCHPLVFLAVIPVKTGIYALLLDSRLRGNDKSGAGMTKVARE